MKRLAAIAFVIVSATGAARADRYEATIAVRPVASLARIADTGAPDPVTVVGGGLAGGMAWGLRNWLDVGAELAGVALAEAKHPGAMVPVSGNAQTGELRRTTRAAQLRAGATLRLGVGWVPTVHVGLGAGARMRSAATLVLASGGTEIAPDDAEGKITLDVVALVRVGLDHRITRRWTAGITAGAAQCFGLGAPDAQLFDATLTLAYSWYPLW